MRLEGWHPSWLPLIFLLDESNECSFFRVSRVWWGGGILCLLLQLQLQLAVSLRCDSLVYYLLAEPQNRKNNLLLEITSCGIGHSPSD